MTPKISLYVPAFRPAYVERAMTMAVDQVVLCLEDGTPPSYKREARFLVSNAVSHFRGDGAQICVRINGFESKLWMADLAAVLVRPPDAIRVPKLRSVAELMVVLRFAQSVLPSEDPALLPRFEVMIESPQGLAMVPELPLIPPVSAVTFGAADYLDSLGPTGQASDVRDARQRLCRVCRGSGLRCLDSTYMDWLDLPGFERDCARSVDEGFWGRSVINPRQIAIARRAYSQGQVAS